VYVDNFCIPAKLLMLAGCVMLSNRDRHPARRPCYFGDVTTLNGILAIRIVQFIRKVEFKNIVITLHENIFSFNENVSLIVS